MNDIKTHYSSPDLLERITRALELVGKTPDSVELEDLARFDEFHLRGAAATEELIKILGVSARAHVLDVGSGLGGPARHLAQASGCRVTGIDLSDDYCSAGNELSRWVGLSERVKLVPGDATEPERFTNGLFDAAWSIHVGMNIEDKAGLYQGIARVLKPSARLVIFDILATGKNEIHFPVPWAAEPAHSFLATVDEMRAHLEAAGFAITEIIDQTFQSIAFLDESFARLEKHGAPPPLSLQTIAGSAFGEAIKCLHGNLTEGLVAPTIIHARKDGRGGAGCG